MRPRKAPKADWSTMTYEERLASAPGNSPDDVHATALDMVWLAIAVLNVDDAESAAYDQRAERAANVLTAAGAMADAAYHAKGGK